MGAFVYFFALLVAAHFVFDPRAMDVSSQPRLLFLSASTICFLACALFFRWHREWNFSVLRDPVILSYAALFAFAALSLCFAVNPTAGVSDLARTAVFLTVLCLSAVLLRSYPGWQEFALQLFVVVGLLCAGIAWIEMWSKWGWGMHPRAKMERVMGLMSNANLHASFLALLLPMTVCASVLLRRSWQILAAIASVALFLMLVFMQTRAVYVGLFFACMAALLGIVCYRRQLGISARALRVLLAASAAALLMGAAFVAVVPEHPVAARVRAIFAGDAGFGAGARTVVWKSTWQMALDHLLTGVGAGNFGVMVHRYYDIHDPALAGVESNWLEPHNDFLWVFAEKGLFGLLCLLAAFFYALFNLCRAAARGASHNNVVIALFSICALVCYAAVSFFDFPLSRPGHQAVLAFYLAVSVALSPRWEITAPSLFVGNRRGILIFAALLCLFAAAHAFAVLRQEWFVRIARQEMVDENWEEVVTNARRAKVPWNQLDPLGVPVVFLEGLGHLMSARSAEAAACFAEAEKQSPYRDYIKHNADVLRAR